MTTRIKLRRDTAANWTETNPVLAQGEPGLETDTSKVKYGDGETAWADLDYASGDSTASLTEEGNVVVTAGSTEHWIATQRREAFDTQPRGLRYDSEGNLYALTETGSDNNNIAVITKYTAAGAVAWQKSFTGANPVALAVDSSDCAYITVEPDAPGITVIKFSTAGAVLWKKEYDVNFPSYGAFIEEKSATTLVLACAVSADSEGPNIVLVMEISSTDGSVQIKKQIAFDGVDQLVRPTGIDVDSDENVFVTGRYWDTNDGKNKMFIEKLDENLNRVWTKSLETDTSYNMYGGDCVSDDQGNIYAVGSYQVNTVNADGTTEQTAGILTKLNSAGVVQWTRRIGPGPCGSFIVGLTATNTGDIYLSAVTFAKRTDGVYAEWSEHDQQALGSNKMLVARIDTQGTAVWQRYVDVRNLYESWESEDDRGQAVAVFGDKFAVDGYGHSWNTAPWNFGETADVESDYFVVQLPTAGTALTIGNLDFVESRVPARFVDHTASSNPLVHSTYTETVLVEDSELTVDAEPRVANNIVKSETYDYVFGADGTLTIPNDGDVRLTQTQVGYIVAIGGGENNDHSVRSRAIAVDGQGNMYVGGEENDDEQPFVTKFSPEGVRQWSVKIQDDENGADGDVESISIHPTTGAVVTACNMYDNYFYGAVITLDQDTGRILDDVTYKDPDADVYLSDIAWSNGNIVLAGSKMGEFTANANVTPLTGSTTGTIVFSRSQVEGAPNNWQIGGTGFSVFENVLSVERYTGLTGNVRQGSGATFDIINNGNGTYSAGAVSGGTNYLPGHKIKILGTSLGGATPANDITITVQTTNNGVITGVGNSGTAANTTPTTATYTAGTEYTTAFVNQGSNSFQVFDPVYEGPLWNAFASNGSVGKTIRIINPNGTFTATVSSSFGGSGFLAITLSDNSTVPDGNATSFELDSIGTVTYTAVSGTNTDVGSGYTFTFQGPRDTTNYNQYWSSSSSDNGTNYVDGDYIVVPGTSLGGTSPDNDLTLRVSASGGAINGVYEFSGTAQSTTWKVETSTQVDFGGSGSWAIVYPLSQESLLITPSWTRTFGTDQDNTDRIYGVSVDTGGNIIAVGEGQGNLTSGNNDDLAIVYKFSPTGTLVWTRKLNDTNDDCYARGVVTIGTDIYVVHENDDDSDTVVSKLDASGNVEWQRTTDSSNDEISMIARTADGNLLVAAEGYNDDSEEDAIKVFLLSPSGEVIYKRWLQATSDSATELRQGRGLAVSGNSFYVTGQFYANDCTSTLVAKLPVDGSGTGDYGSFRYQDVNAAGWDNYFSEPGIDEDINYSIDPVDLEDGYAGPLYEGEEVYIKTNATYNTGTGDFYINSYYPQLTIETVHDTDGGSIVFADGTKQSTSATDIPQRRYSGQRYTLGMKDRGHHILCNNVGDAIIIPYNARVEFPIGTVITIVNNSGGTVNIEREGGSVEVILAGDGAYSYFDLSNYGIATLLKIGRDRWIISGNVQPD